MNSHPTYPLSAVRALALHAQHLTQPCAPGDSSPAPQDIYAVIEQMGCVQIDTLQMVRRSHYIALWSRLGAYEPADLERVAYGRVDGKDSRSIKLSVSLPLSEAQPDSGSLRNVDGQDRRLFEYWLHAACLIPLSEYRYRLPVMRWYREGGGWRHEWAQQPENIALMKAVLARVKKEGALRASDFEHTGMRRGSWWDWKPAKQALEHLYNQGRLMIAGRVNFQRQYDLPERVLPAWVDQSEPTHEETQRFWLSRSLKALGIVDPGLAAMMVQGFKRPEARALLKELVAAGEAVEVQAILADGAAHDLVLHRDHVATLQQAADGALNPARTTFLSPFDNLLWAPGRMQAFWDFRQSLEAYVPREKRQYGYFTLPILHRDRFVGRFDPKLERQTGTLRLKAIYLEPKVKPDEELVSEMAGALRDFMRFHEATDLVIESSTPATFGRKLMKAV
ncbi:MAG: winged helix DNA-binding domain-containing protein [Chloroflexi bacterium]|nr:winged helix DNA-binding domain-containing protein [Chloroflexota bacterium]